MVIIEHPNTSHKLSKTIRRTKFVSQVGAGKISNSPLYSETTKSEKKKNSAKITNQSHSKGHASTYSVKILNSFNPDIQLKDTEYAIRNKLIDLVTELKDFKFMTILALEFKKEKMMIKKYIVPFTRMQKQKQLLMKVTLICT